MKELLILFGLKLIPAIVIAMGMTGLYLHVEYSGWVLLAGILAFL